VGIAGSTELGRNVTMGGQAGAAGHIHIGDNSVVASGSGATRDVPPATVVSGFPAREHNSTRRMWARSAQLPDLFARVKELERLVKELRKGVTVDSAAEDDR
jgi:UDP-3-O-[3-hydroxymyristoyl] glucosamine N-acyltransferase